MQSQETMYRITRIVWYVFGVIEALLLLRFILRLFAANPGAPFTDLIYGITAVLIAPFRYVFGTPSLGGSALEVSTLLALLVYWLLAWAIVKFVVMNRPVNRFEAAEELHKQDES